MKEELSNKNPNYFYSLSSFPELETLETNYVNISHELNQLISNKHLGFWLNTFPDYVISESNKPWRVYTFRFFGIKHLLNCRICPETSKLLSSIPNLISADFSCLPGNTVIKPHRGFTKMVLRVHLGLVVPKDCGIRVGNERKKWEQGKLLIFDDSYEHEAWNNSDEDRFILMLDIANPHWDYSADEINKYKIENLSDPYMLSMFPKEKWMQFYTKGFFDIPEAI